MKIAKRRRPKRAADLADRISERLVEAIVSHELLPGMPLREAKLAKEWGISRTPLREAIREAAAMGLLELRPNRMPVIRQLTADDVAKLYTVRETLELLALDLAHQQLALHEQILHKRPRVVPAERGRHEQHQPCRGNHEGPHQRHQGGRTDPGGAGGRQ